MSTKNQYNWPRIISIFSTYSLAANAPPTRRQLELIFQEHSRSALFTPGGEQPWARFWNHVCSKVKRPDVAFVRDQVIDSVTYGQWDAGVEDFLEAERNGTLGSRPFLTLLANANARTKYCKDKRNQFLAISRLHKKEERLTCKEAGELCGQWDAGASQPATRDRAGALVPASETGGATIGVEPPNRLDDTSPPSPVIPSPVAKPSPPPTPSRLPTACQRNAGPPTPIHGRDTLSPAGPVHTPSIGGPTRDKPAASRLPQLDRRALRSQTSARPIMPERRSLRSPVSTSPGSKPQALRPSTSARPLTPAPSSLLEDAADDQRPYSPMLTSPEPRQVLHSPTNGRDRGSPMLTSPGLKHEAGDVGMLDYPADPWAEVAQEESREEQLSQQRAPSPHPAAQEQEQGTRDLLAIFREREEHLRSSFQQAWCQREQEITAARREEVLRDAHSQHVQAVGQLRDEIERLQREVESKGGQLRVSEAELKDMQAEHQNVLTRLKTVDELQQEVVRLQAEVGKKDHDLHDRTDRLQEMQSRLDAGSNILTQLRAEVGRGHQQLEATEAQRVQELQKHQQAVEELHRQYVISSDGQLHALNQLQADVQAKDRELQAREAQHAQEQQTMTAKHKAVMQHHESQEHTLSQLRSQVSHFHHELDTKDQELQAIKTQYEQEQRRQRTTHTTPSSTQDDSIRHLQDEAQKLRRDLQAQRAQYARDGAEAEASAQWAADELEKAHAELRERRHAAQTWEVQVSDLQAETQRQEEIVQTQRAQLEHLQRRVGELQRPLLLEKTDAVAGSKQEARRGASQLQRRLFATWARTLVEELLLEGDATGRAWLRRSRDVTRAEKVMEVVGGLVEMGGLGE